jgi:hypothetical protein
VGSEGARVDAESGHCYVAWKGPLSWMAAQQQCVARGGALAGLDSEAEKMLVETLAGDEERWLALGGSNTDGDCTHLHKGTLEDAPCGWPATGNLPSSPSTQAGFVCEHSCGNLRLEAGEECDPPGAACTASCQRIRSCPEGMTSAVTGHCYFLTATAAAYSVTACPAGSHVATLEAPDETALARMLVTAGDAWFGLRSLTMVSVFAWDVPGETFVARRYHGFVASEPNGNITPACIRVATDGWRDQTCNNHYVHLCERE